MSKLLYASLGTARRSRWRRLRRAVRALLEALHDSRRRAAHKVLRDNAHLLADERSIASLWLNVYW